MDSYDPATGDIGMCWFYIQKTEKIGISRNLNKMTSIVLLFSKAAVNNIKEKIRLKNSSVFVWRLWNWEKKLLFKMKLLPVSLWNKLRYFFSISKYDNFPFLRRF